MKKVWEWLKLCLSGFLMALADSVPGVSGGTVAFFAGIYEPFVGSFPALISGKKEEKRAALRFLLRLGIGWLIGMALAVLLLARLFETHIYTVSSLFVGLVAASVVVIAKEERETLRGMGAWDFLALLLGATLVVLLCIVRFPVAAKTLTFPLALYTVLGGALAISAMVLPGISGSTLLLAFGLYVPVLTGLRSLLHFDFSAFWLLFFFGIGVLGGIAGFFPLARRLLTRHRRLTVYAIIGLMIGSVYAVFQGPATLSQPLPALGRGTFQALPFLVGVLIVVAVGIARHFGEKRKEKAPLREVPTPAEDNEE